ncbi:hypothetical protein IJJ12_03890 [bacterium]|nr:hypothetical protein [bacterium]
MYTFLLATTNQSGLTCAQGLLDAGFTCVGVLSPVPRPVGRHRIPTPAPSDIWAKNHHLPVFYSDKKIDSALKNQLPACDFLLVVDFGFYIPRWLVAWPKLLAVNVHPSRLPEWRGASPGQFVLLHRQKESAVSIMTLTPEMDAGDLLAQIPFPVDPAWDAAAYYQHAFALARAHVGALLFEFASGKKALQPQVGAPTFAPKLTKQDAFIPWDQLFDPALAPHHEAMIRAFSPWPLAWTLAPTAAGDKRLQLLRAHLAASRLVLNRVRLEGDTAKPWTSIQSKITSM